MIIGPHDNRFFKGRKDQCRPHFAFKFQVFRLVIVQCIKREGIEFEKEGIPPVGIVLCFGALVIDERVFLRLHGRKHLEVFFTGFIVRCIHQQYAGYKFDRGVHRIGLFQASIDVFFPKRQIKVKVLDRVKLYLEFIIIESHILAFKQSVTCKKATGQFHVPVFQQNQFTAPGNYRHVLPAAEFQSFDFIDRGLFGFHIQRGIRLRRSRLNFDGVKVFFTSAG